MNPAQPQLNEILGKDGAAESATSNPSKPNSDALDSTKTGAIQTTPFKKRPSFWEAAFYWAMARH